MGDVKFRHGLNSGQLAVLELVYKYRFCSVDLLLHSLGLRDSSSLYRKLVRLCEQGYIGKRYDSSYKLLGRSAAYYLLPKGFRALQKLEKYQDLITDATIKASYKDKTLKEDFIDHNLAVYAASFEFMKLHSTLKFFAKRELVPYSYFPNQRPDGFLSIRINGKDEEPLRFFVDYIEDSMPRFILDKKVKDYVTFFEEGGWDSTGRDLPTMLLLCESPRLEMRVQRLVSRKLYSLSSDEPLYYTTNLELLNNASKKKQVIWTSIDDSDEVLELAAISVNQ